MNSLLTSSPLENIPWLEHGFGTRQPSAWPQADTVTTLRQIHSDKILVASGQPGSAGEGDALITNRPGTALSVRTADCLPILIVDVNKRAIAAVHAGWRGTIRHIAVKTIHALVDRYGCNRGDLRIAIGPGIGPCCFEVGPEVAIQFEIIFPERHDLRGRTRLDLADANRREFIQEGIAPHHIDIAGLCTSCRGDLFHSYRREREKSGRQISAVDILANR